MTLLLPNLCCAPSPFVAPPSTNTNPTHHLPAGVGPKVAACICLFSLDKHDAIPVDTHVWNLATRYYAPHLAKKSLTPKLHAEVQQAFVDRFGPYAGWAHNFLFVAELASHKHLLPTGLSTAAAGSGGSKQKKRKSGADSGGDESSDGVDVVEEASVAVETVAAAGGSGEVSTPAQASGGRRRRRTPSKKQQEALAAAALLAAAEVESDLASC